jgi:hypothetical protein
MDTESELRLAEIQSLKKGWMDGCGDEVPDVVIRATTTLLKEWKRNNMEAPAIAPTEEGEISLNWDNKAVSAVVFVQKLGYELHMYYRSWEATKEKKETDEYVSNVYQFFINEEEAIVEKLVGFFERKVKKG